jgi:hypothetical protein
MSGLDIFAWIRLATRRQGLQLALGADGVLIGWK